MHLYISHSFDHAEKHERLVGFLREEGLNVSDFSVPVWRQVLGDEVNILEAISERIRRASRVLVLITDEIHKSRYIDFEVRVARALGKLIIGVYPNGENEGPIPAVLDGVYYRMVGWRRGALAKALDGEYPVDRRVFDIAEVEERRKLIRYIAGAAGIVSLVVAGATAVNFLKLKNELEQRGVVILTGSTPTLLETAAPLAIGGAALGAVVMALCVGTGKAIASGAAIGGAFGLGVGATKYFRARIEHLGSLAHVELTPCTRG